MEQNLEQNDSEHHVEQSWSLQEWINNEVQSNMAEEQLHMNQEQLDQSCATEVQHEYK